MSQPGGLAPPAAVAYLTALKTALPGKVDGFYLGGSVALGAYLPARSDLDFLCVLSDVDPGDLRRLRAVQVRMGVRNTVRQLAAGRSGLTGWCNGTFVEARHVGTPVSKLVPIASQIAQSFSVGTSPDLNPPTWKVLAERGVTLHGPEIGELGLDPEPASLTTWVAGNVESYWRPWAGRIGSAPTLSSVLRLRWNVAWGVLGIARMHYTLATHEIASKETAGAYALDTFDASWHPIIHVALEQRTGRHHHSPGSTRPRHLRRTTAAFVEHVADNLPPQ